MVRAAIPSASRTGLPRPSAATTMRARSRLPSVRATMAPASRVTIPAKPVPGRKSTPGIPASRATISRRKSQLGRFQPKG